MTSVLHPDAPAAVASRFARRLGVETRELIALAAIVLVGAALRFASLPFRGGWDSDQGTEMLALRAALSAGRLPTFGPEAISVSNSFHHGALYYDLLLPAAWLGNGDPVWVVAEIALLSLIVIPAVWWIARTIGGASAGLTAALLAACSASLISYSTFIWNPTLVEPGAAVAFLGAWQAIRSQRARWWVAAAIGAAVAAQAHVAAAVIVVPLVGAFVIDLRRAGPGRRRSVLTWGVFGVAIFVATYAPLIAYELSHDFADTRGMLAYFNEPGASSSAGPLVRLLFAAIRILAWPITRWPQMDLDSAFSAAFLIAWAIVGGLVWRLLRTRRREPVPDDGTAPESAASTDERMGVRLVGGWLLLLILTLGLGLRSVSEMQSLPTEQYHVVADPLVLVAVALVVGGLWREMPTAAATRGRRTVAGVLMVALLVWNAGHWPPLTAPDGGWPAGQTVASRLELRAAGTPVALVPLFRAKGSDAILYPLLRDGITVEEPDTATTIVVLCDMYWTDGCGGSAEDAWVASAGYGPLTRIDRFNAAPDKIVTVYRKAP